MNQVIQHQLLPFSLVSSLLWLGAITISLAYWSRRKRLTESKLMIAFGGMIGAFAGAKLCYLIAEAPLWWNDPLFWMRMLAGKTILGGLLGGWVGVEFAKHSVGVTRIMGDEFAGIIPIGISIGRLGCHLHGCCPGRPVAEVFPAEWAIWLQQLGLERSPTAWLEIAFQMTFWSSCLATRNLSWSKGQQFHLYLFAYGIFRVLHEPFRDTVRYQDTTISPYMILAGFMAFCGLIAFVRRSRIVAERKAR